MTLSHLAGTLAMLGPAGVIVAASRQPAEPAPVAADPARSSAWLSRLPGRFDTIPLPSRGALVRHLAVDPRNGAVWVAYGASPGIPARIARVMVR